MSLLVFILDILIFFFNFAVFHYYAKYQVVHTLDKTIVKTVFLKHQIIKNQT